MPTEKYQSLKLEKSQLPGNSLRLIFWAGVTSFWKPLGVAGVKREAARILAESKKLCAKDRRLAAASHEVLLHSP